MKGSTAAASPLTGAHRSHSGSSSPVPSMLAATAPPSSSHYPTARRGSAPAGRPAIMIALSGWPEPVYVASDPSTLWGSRSGAATPPQVYDGIGGPPVLPPALKQGAFGANWPAMSAGSSDPAPGPKTFPGAGLVASSTASSAAPSPAYTPTSAAPSPTPSAAPAKTPSPYARPPARGAVTTATTAAFTPTPHNLTAATPGSAPAPLAPNFSIFSTTCPHLADPSLGPCPFPTHPHDIRGMFPPTSHLAKSPPRGRGLAGGARMPGMASGSSAKAHPFAPPSNPVAPPRTLAEAEQQHRELTGEKEKTPTPPKEDGPAPPTFTPLPTKSSIPARAPTKSYPPALPPVPKFTTAFQDPRYKPSASIFHKGRALPVVPSWSSSPPPSAPSTPNVEEATLPSFGMADAEMEDAESKDKEDKERAKERERERKGFVGVMRATPEVYPPPPGRHGEGKAPDLGKEMEVRLGGKGEKGVAKGVHARDTDMGLFWRRAAGASGGGGGVESAESGAIAGKGKGKADEGMEVDEVAGKGEAMEVDVAVAKVAA
ncbi:hypothetical protein IAT38_005923 [Cryptococcus sp. DSM 104549]